MLIKIENIYIAITLKLSYTLKRNKIYIQHRKTHYIEAPPPWLVLELKTSEPNFLAVGGQCAYHSAI